MRKVCYYSLAFYCIVLISFNGFLASHSGLTVGHLAVLVPEAHLGQQLLHIPAPFVGPGLQADCHMGRVDHRVIQVPVLEQRELVLLAGPASSPWPRFTPQSLHALTYPLYTGCPEHWYSVRIRSHAQRGLTSATCRALQPPSPLLRRPPPASGFCGHRQQVQRSGFPSLALLRTPHTAPWLCGGAPADLQAPQLPTCASTALCIIYI